MAISVDCICIVILYFYISTINNFYRPLSFRKVSCGDKAAKGKSCVSAPVVGRRNKLRFEVAGYSHFQIKNMWSILKGLIWLHGFPLIYPLKTTMEPENEGFQNESPLPGVHFQVRPVCFGGSITRNDLRYDNDSRGNHAMHSKVLQKLSYTFAFTFIVFDHPQVGELHLLQLRVF